MTLLELIQRVANRCGKDADNADFKARCIGHINDSIQEQWDGHEWSFRHKEYPLVLTARTTSGTMTATNGSQSITASGTPFVTGTHENAWIRFTGDSPEAWYRIFSVDSTSTAKIEPAYQGTTASGKSYELVRTDYRLPSEIADVVSIRNTASSTPLEVTYLDVLDLYRAPEITTGIPRRAALYDSDSIGSSYTTGTVTGTINTWTLTGSGSAWLTNAYPGDEVVIGTNKYRILRVNSDTSITLYNALKVSVSGTTYSINRQFGRFVRFSSTTDDAHTFFVRGLRKYAPLVNDNDVNEVTHRYAPAAIESATWRELASSPDSREDSNYLKASSMWEQARAEDRKLTKRRNPGATWNMR